MIIKLTNGQTDRIILRNYRMKEISKSDLQHRIGQILKKIFRYDIICEDVYIPQEKLYLDFLIPASNLVIEVQGRQHFEFVPYFHKDLVGFNKHQERDRRKLEWCKLNSLKFIEIFVSDKEQDIINKILGKTHEL